MQRQLCATNSEHTDERTALPAGRHRRHANPFAVRGKREALDLGATFAKRQPLALDVGCGPGAFVADLARARPHYNVLGLEIRAHLVVLANARIEAAALQNAHVVYANANSQLDDLLPEARLSLVTINFPDPWFKLRHHKRRVLTPAFAAWLATHLVDGGEVHAMTDVESLAHVMRRALVAAGFTDLHGPDVWPQASTTDVSSEREIWHRGRQDPIWRLAFRAAATGRPRSTPT